MTSRSDIVAAARGYLGVRYQHLGRSRHGIDCIGLPVMVANDLDLAGHDEKGYAPSPDGRRLCAGLLKAGCVDVGLNHGDGDILVFWIRHPKRPQHVAIATGPDMMIHTHSTAGKVVEHPIEKHWRPRLHTAFRYPGVE